MDTGQASQLRPLALVGVTASGKSSVAMALAAALAPPVGTGVELISADSMQVYRGMDIGTAKPSPAEQAQVPHHLIDVVDPHEDFDVATFVRQANAALDDIAERGHAAIVVGGTGLYHQALIDAFDIPGQYPEVAHELSADEDTSAMWKRLATLDPASAELMEPTNRRRVIRALEVTVGSGRPFSSFGPGVTHFGPTRFVQIGLTVERSELLDRVRERYVRQLDAGLLDEVRSLWGRPQGLSKTARQALGYKELLPALDGTSSLQAAVDDAVLRIRQFAVRQERWFRRDPRIVWVDAPTGAPGSIDEVATAVLSIWRTESGRQR